MARQRGDWYWRPRIKRDELLVMGINSRECGLEFCWILDYPAGVKWRENKFEIILPFLVVNVPFGCSISCADGARHYIRARNKGSNWSNIIDIATRSSKRIPTDPTKQTWSLQSRYFVQRENETSKLLKKKLPIIFYHYFCFSRWRKSESFKTTARSSLTTITGGISILLHQVRKVHYV